MTLTIPFPGAAVARLEEVGGKAFSLIRMGEAGLPVPPGVVLTTGFFEPWFDEVQTTPAWDELTRAEPDRWPALCEELKRIGSALPLTALQRQAMAELREHLAALGCGGLLAVRSSSPEEDLESASFAGGYETRLGVRADELEDAVRRCFASSLDQRVLVYKREHGFAVFSPRLAVVVQQQLDSETAGVGFSLDPLTNDYDEAVFEANRGLGESVVSGLASPDRFVVDKVGRRVLSREPGAKQVVIRLDPEGGTVEQESRASELTLSDAQLVELTGLVHRIEELYGKPVDIEWAYASGRLHVLQARPVTAYVPLPPELLTRPDERRRLYADAALSKGMTMNAPISPMGLDWMRKSFSQLGERYLGRLGLELTPEEGLLYYTGGRMYMDLSNLFWLMSPKRLAKASAATDELMSAIVGSVDVERYQTPRRPRWARLRMIRFVPRLLWRLRRFFWGVLRILLFPERARRVYDRKVEAFESELRGQIDYGLPLDKFLQAYFTDRLPRALEVSMPALMASLAALGALEGVAPRKPAGSKALAEKLETGFTGNVVTEMGIALFRLARRLDRSDFEDLPRLAERIETRQLPAEFLQAWDAFLANFGNRGPMEMDLARPRYADDPMLALTQMTGMSLDDESYDPDVAHRRRVEERRQAYGELMKRSGWLRRRLLRRVYQIIDLFAGARDTPKHHNLLFHQVVRKRLLIEGRRLAGEGRLDAAEDVFDLTFHDLEEAARDPSLDLRRLGAARRRFLEKLEAHVTEFPQVIDSRGRILRPPRREEKPGELSGTAVSPGVARGPVRLLRDPHEKSVEKGDVLVAYTTDPGWTPLFVNAAAVVLEVGGILQHGAVVAREYGKPCVVGIDRVMSRLREGQRVEVDGTQGVVRLL